MIIAVFVWILIVEAVVAQNLNPFVCIEDGCIQGRTMAGFKTQNFDAFLGIPFAKPPVRELRFANPQPVDAWAGIWNATIERNMCIQKNYLLPEAVVQGDEDCLYLNVYRPQASTQKQVLLPVMVYIHGGGFFSGSITPALHGPSYFMDSNEVILVLMQYRLASLGFLSTGDDECPGNFALKDQNMALRWVQRNIKRFGGNPKLVTLFGQSAGAASVHMHMLSPLSKNLFHRAIVMSGNAIAPYNYVVKDPLSQTREQAKYLDILNADELISADLMKELRKIDAATLVESADKFKFWSKDPLTIFRPVIEFNTTEAFLVENPIETMKTGNFHHVAWMTGVVENEGIVRAGQILTNATLLSELNDCFDVLGPKLMEIGIQDESELRVFWQKVKNFYFDGANIISEVNKQRFIDLYSDRAFLYPLYKSVEQYVQYANVKKHPVHLYRFAFKSMFSYTWLLTGTQRDFGVGHIDDLIYLFHSPLLFPNFPKESVEAKMIAVFVKTFVKFAKTGQPKRWVPIDSCSSISMTSFCEYQEFTRLTNTTPNEIVVKRKSDFDLSMVRLWNQLEELR